MRNETSNERYLEILKLSLPSMQTNLIRRLQFTVCLAIMTYMHESETKAITGLGLGYQCKLIMGSELLKGLNGGIDTYVS